MIEEARGLGLRQGSWKYVRGRGKQAKEQLYDLDADVGERNNLISTEQAKAKEMRELLERLVADKKGMRRRAG